MLFKITLCIACIFSSSGTPLFSWWSRRSSAPNTARGRRIAIYGAGPVGLVSAVAALKENPNNTVRLFDTRNTFTRRIQWSVRKSFMKYIRHLDEQLYTAISDILTPVKKRVDDGKSDYSIESFVADPCPSRDFLEEKALYILKCDDLQRVLLQYLQTKNRFQFTRISRERIVDEEANQGFDLILDSRGAGAQGNNIQTLAHGEEVHLAYVVKLDRNVEMGVMEKKTLEIELNGANERFIIGIQGQTNEIWVVQRIDDSFRVSADRNVSQHKVLEIAEIAIEEIPQLNSCRIQDITDVNNRPIERGVTPFRWSPNLVNRAFHKNEGRPPVLYIGDRVGNAHWSIGGGMQIGTVLHTQRLVSLLKSSKIDDDILMQYSRDVIHDTYMWCNNTRGRNDMHVEWVDYDFKLSDASDWIDYDPLHRLIHG